MPTTTSVRLRAFGAACLAVACSGAAFAQADAPVPVRHRHSHVDPPGLQAGVTVHPAAPAGLALAYSGRHINVTTFHYDGLRTGWNQRETALTPASVASGRFGLLTTLAVDGNVFAQPLLVSGFVMPDGTTHDVLVIATGHNSVYAYDAQTYAVLWQISLGPAQSSADIGCGDVLPEYGISSTPVIVRAAANAATIYLVSASEPSSMVFDTTLHALDLGTGADLQPPVSLAPSGTLTDGSKLAFNPRQQWNRAGLAFANNSLYIGIGSHCDNVLTGVTGWLLRYSPALRLLAAFHTVSDPNPTVEMADIWMSGFAPAIDPLGGVFVVTGNGEYNIGNGHRDYGQTVLALTPTLGTVRSTFTPSNFTELTDNDIDFGSGGVMLVPKQPDPSTPPLAVAIGKDAVLYLLGRHLLGGTSPNDAGALWSSRLGPTNTGTWGGPAYYLSPSGPLIYVQITNDVLRGFALTGGATPVLSPALHGTTLGGYGGSMPIVSSNGGLAGTGVLWLLRRGSTVNLEAYDATKLGAPIYTAGAGAWSNPGASNPFLTAMQANGRVYVPGYRLVKVFGLTS